MLKGSSSAVEIIFRLMGMGMSGGMVSFIGTGDIEELLKDEDRISEGMTELSEDEDRGSGDIKEFSWVEGRISEDIKEFSWDESRV